MRILLFLMFLTLGAQAQEKDTTDVDEIVKSLFSKDKSAPKPASTFSLLPAIGYNPSIGFMVGATIAAGKHLGPHTTTNMSTVTATAFITTKRIINLQLRHNIFTANNAYNFQGNFQLTRMVVLDYGLGTGAGRSAREGFSINQFTLDDNSAVYPINYNHVRLNEKAYKKIARGLMVGAGVAIDYHFRIDDERLQQDSSTATPHYKYSVEQGFNPRNYFANGLLLNIQYTTRDHVNRPYKGMYADITIRTNARWLGSTKASTQLTTEFRKYFSLSKRNPEHVLAFWHLGTYRLGGVLPYLDLPATATDMYNRSGRAYTIGRFRGPSLFYLESEYRFPITRNELISGVVFANMQTVSNGSNIDLFDGYEPGGGMGLRILFNRRTRTNICIDYAFGRYGANGLFFGLNEVF